MSGIFRDGHWYGNTGMVCRRCGSPAYLPGHAGYSYQCFRCDEDLYSFEVMRQDGLRFPKVAVARPVNGIALNGVLEYLLDGNRDVRIFNNQPEAEAFLLANGFINEDLEFLYFVEVDDGLQADCRERWVRPDTEGK